MSLMFMTASSSAISIYRMPFYMFVISAFRAFFRETAAYFDIELAIAVPADKASIRDIHFAALDDEHLAVDEKVRNLSPDARYDIAECLTRYIHPLGAFFLV